MKPDTIFVGVDADNFGELSQWWSKLLGRHWDNEPMPSCHEWNLTDDVLFQVRDNPKLTSKGRVTMRVDDVDAERERLAALDIEIPAPGKVEGFETLRYCEFSDPEGNTVGLLDGR